MFDSQSRPRELLSRRAASAACGEVLWAALADPAARTAPVAPAPDAPRADHTDHWSPLLTLTLAVLGLALLWAAHAVWDSRHRTGRDPATIRNRERRGF